MLAPELISDAERAAEKRQEEDFWNSEHIRHEYAEWLEQELADYLTAEELAADLDDTGIWDCRE